MKNLFTKFVATPTTQRNSSEAYARTTLVPHVLNAHNPGDLQGGSEPPCTRFLSRFAQRETAFHLTCVKEMNQNLLQSEHLVRSPKNFFKFLQLFFKTPLTNHHLSCIIYPVIQRQQVSVKACRSPAEEDVNLTHTGVLRPFFAQSFGTDGESFLFFFSFFQFTIGR